jgi:16S rRNA (uracil1498-N3)-methyltransferase
MDHSNTRKIRADRLETIIKEAAEQSEGLSLPKLHNIQPLKECLATFEPSVKIYVALERQEDRFSDTGWPANTGVRGVVIGPEGGFSEEERNWFLGTKKVIPLSLGERVLRAETAAIAALSVLQFQS